MRRFHKIALWTGAGVAGYLLLLVVLGWVARGLVEAGVRERLAASLDAEAEVGGASVSLVRGEASVDRGDHAVF